MTKEEHDIETSKNQENYDHVLENINVSLKKSRKQNGKEDKNELKAKLYLRKNEEVRSKSRSIEVKEAQESDLKRSPCRSNTDIR